MCAVNGSAPMTLTGVWGAFRFLGGSLTFRAARIPNASAVPDRDEPWPTASRHHHRVPPVHAARLPSLNRVLAGPPRCAGRGKLTLRSNSPFTRCAEVGAAPSGRARVGSGSTTGITLPSSLRCNVIVDEQQRRSQKYSAVVTLDDLRVGSFSGRKSLPSLR